MYVYLRCVYMSIHVYYTPCVCLYMHIHIFISHLRVYVFHLCIYVFKYVCVSIDTSICETIYFQDGTGETTEEHETSRSDVGVLTPPLWFETWLSLGALNWRLEELRQQAVLGSAHLSLHIARTKWRISWSSNSGMSVNRGGREINHRGCL